MPSTEFFNTLDYIYFGIIFLFSIWGYFTGFTSRLLRILALVGSAYIAPFLTPLFKPIAFHFIESKFIAKNVALGVSYVITLLILSLLAYSITKAVRESALSFFDHALGLFSGFFLAFVFIVPIYMVLVAIDYDYKSSPLLNNSRVSTWMFRLIKHKAPNLKEKGVKPYLESFAHLLFSDKQSDKEEDDDEDIGSEIEKLTKNIKMPDSFSVKEFDNSLKALSNSLGGGRDKKNEKKQVQKAKNNFLMK